MDYRLVCHHHLHLPLFYNHPIVRWKTHYILMQDVLRWHVFHPKVVKQKLILEVIACKWHRHLIFGYKYGSNFYFKSHCHQASLQHFISSLVGARSKTYIFLLKLCYFFSNFCNFWKIFSKMLFCLKVEFYHKNISVFKQLSSVSLKVIDLLYLWFIWDFLQGF